MTRGILWSALAATAVYVGHSALLGTWIVDDAGISFAYARSLAAGHGLVAQPDAVPVEGFTNLAWVVLLALTMLLRSFDPVWTPKILAAVCVGVAFAATGVLVAARGRRPAWLVGVALTVPALCSGFAIWCASGLENALYVALVALLGVVMMPDVEPAVFDITRARSQPRAPAVNRARAASTSEARAVAAGGILFLLFCTRPDAALYFWIAPFLFGVAARGQHRRRPLGLYITAFLVPWLLLTLFRSIYFQDVFPNTFYAKKGEGAKIFGWMLVHWSFPWVVATVMALGTICISAVGWGCHALGARLGKRLALEWSRRYSVVLLFVTAYGIVLALPGDWMREHRFATPMFLFGPATALIIAWEGLARTRSGARTLLVGSLAAAAFSVAGAYSARHTPAFVRAPTLGLDAVRANSVRIAASLEPLGGRPTVLTPDIGGALWEDRFRVLDLVGLTDRVLGRDMHRDRDTIRRHILEERRPEGVWVHTFWMGVTGFDVDPAFRLAYAPVWEERATPGAPPVAGFYLRRDLGIPRVDGRAVPPRAPESAP